jgi:hypothetical protein
MSEVFICNRRFRQVEGMPMVDMEVLVDGVKYRCDALALAMLEDGVCLDDIDMERVDDGD